MRVPVWLRCRLGTLVEGDMGLRIARNRCRLADVGGYERLVGRFPATRDAVPINGQYVENAITNYRKLTNSLHTRAVFANLNLLHRLAPFESTTSQSTAREPPSPNDVMLGEPFPAFIDGNGVARGEATTSDSCNHGCVSMLKNGQAKVCAATSFIS